MNDKMTQWLKKEFKMNVVDYNREAWDRQVESGQNPWTQPVSREVIDAARRGEWTIVLTEQKPIPASWFPKHPFLTGLDVLGLASGGGQQGPVLAAAGANVTIFDNSPKQLEKDRFVAERDGLNIRTVQGDAANLSMFADASFDLIVHPVSNVFMPDVKPVWREAYRVLRKGGALLSGFMNPDIFVFDPEPADGKFVVKYALPYSDTTYLTDEERVRLYGDSPMEHSHTLADQIGGQLDTGFVLAAFYEDCHKGDDQAARFLPTYFATRSIKL
jgi:SAM-dependent methyltransferase